MHKLILFLSLILLSSCATARTDATALVLVHGAHFDERSLAHLNKHFPHQKVINVRMPNQDRSDPAYYKGLSLKTYAVRVCQEIKKLRKSWLIGHSQGGAVINQALGLCPEKIKGLIYIAATVPFPGEEAFSLLEARDEVHYFTAVKEDEGSGVFKVIDKVKFIDAFAPDLRKERRAALLKLIKDEPVAPAKSKLEFDLERLQNLPKLMMITTEDRIITMQSQEKYLNRLSNVRVNWINSGHLPQLTREAEVVDTIRNFLDL